MCSCGKSKKKLTPVQVPVPPSAQPTITEDTTEILIQQHREAQQLNRTTQKAMINKSSKYRNAYR